MARPLRIEYEGAFYHVMNRGLEQREIFEEERDYEKFLELIEDTHRQYQFRIHSYCLMSNHYHLYVETPQGGLSQGMRHIDGVYTQIFNKRRRRIGPLFQGRYKAILVEKENYSLELSRYIHLNPVKAKMVEKPEGWRWSSYGAFMGKAKRREFLETDWILGQLAKKKKAAQRAFEKFTLEGMKEAWEPAKEAEGGYLLGGKSFCEWVRQEFLGDREDKEIPQLRRVKKSKSAEEIEEIAKRIAGEERYQRKLWIYGMRRYSQMSLRQIAEKAGAMSYYGVSKVVNRLDQEAETDRKVKQWLAKFHHEMSRVQT